MRRSVFLAALVALLCVGLVGCGGPDGQSDSRTEERSDAQPAGRSSDGPTIEEVQTQWEEDAWGNKRSGVVTEILSVKDAETLGVAHKVMQFEVQRPDGSVWRCGARFEQDNLDCWQFWDGPDCEEVSAADLSLRIGTLLPQSGALAVLGPPMVEAVNMAIRDINEAGGVNGDDVELVVGDSGTNEQVTAETAERLISSDQVNGIIGPASLQTTLSVIDKITSSGIPMCSPSNTGSSLTNYEANVPGFYFRTAPPDNLQGPALADVILADGHRRVAVVALNDEYGQGFASFLKSALAEGGATLAVDVAYDPNGRDFSADIQQVVDTAPDAVVLISFPDTGTPILAGLIESGLRPDMLYTADGMQSSDVIGQFSTGVLNGMKGTAPSAHGTQKFTDDFAKFAPGAATIFSAHAYDCAIIMALAAESSGSTEPADVAAAMVGVTSGGTRCDTYASCKAILDDGGEIDYDGASGLGEWVPQGEPGAGTYDVWEFRDGRIVTLDSIEVG